MKKILIAALVFLSFTSAFAGNGNSIEKLINKHITVPVKLKEEKSSQKATVTFRIESNGTATVIDVVTPDPEVKKEIIKQFSTIDFSHISDKQAITYSIDINFKVL